jgi:hypothetical protein
MHERQSQNAFFGNIQNFLRECAVSDGVLDWSTRSRFLDRLVELEEKHLHQWVSQYTVLIEIVRRARLAIESLDDKRDGTLEDVIGNERLEAVAKQVGLSIALERDSQLNSGSVEAIDDDEFRHRCGLMEGD